MDPELRREIILEHNSHPFNRKTIEDKKFIKVNSNNASCIDNINLYVLFEDDKLTDIYFDGEACAISTSATSIMLKSLIGKTISEIEYFITNYENMINEYPYNKDILGESLVFDEIYKQQNRKTCALIPYIGIKKAIKEYKDR